MHIKALLALIKTNKTLRALAISALLEQLQKHNGRPQKWNSARRAKD